MDTDSTPAPGAASGSTLSVPSASVKGKAQASGSRKKAAFDFSIPPGDESDFDEVWAKLLALEAKSRYGDPTVSTAAYNALADKSSKSSDEVKTFDSWKKSQTQTKSALTRWGTLAAKDGFHLIISDDPEFGVREDLRLRPRAMSLAAMRVEHPALLFRSEGVPAWTAGPKRKRGDVQCEFGFHLFIVELH